VHKPYLQSGNNPPMQKVVSAANLRGFASPQELQFEPGRRAMRKESSRSSVIPTASDLG
jgi:hypothetical protein